MFDSIYYYIFYYYYNLKTRGLYYLPFKLKSECDEVYPNIFIGNLHTIIDTEELEKNNIKNIVSAINGIPVLYPEKFNYLNLELLDESFFDIKSSFSKSNKFIDKCLENNEKVYVHCMCGVSRSSTIVIAYLMYKYNFTLLQSIDKLKLSRPKINPNSGFIKQLGEYYEELHK